MATIVYLDVDDEITSAANRIRSTEEGRVALVVPNGSRLATSRINFRLLAREAQSRGRRLGIVAGDPATRALAASAGLPVFGSVGEYEDSLEMPRPDDATAIEASAGQPAGPAAELAAIASPAAEGLEPGKGSAAAVPTGAAVVPTGSAAVPTGSAAVPTGAARSTPAASTIAAPTAHGSGAPPPPPSPPSKGRQGGPPASVAVVGPSRGLPIGRTGLAVLAAVVVLAVVIGGVAAYLLLPSAKITVTARPEPIGPVELLVVADPSTSAPSGVMIPAERLTVDLAASDTFKATDRRIEETKASGRVTFRSKDFLRETRIGAGSVVSTPNRIRFRTDATITVPKATVIGLTIVPAEASVGVTAVEAGPDGNVDANTITVIPADQDPTLLDVRNREPTSGGTHEEFPRVGQTDIDGALEQLTKQIGTDFAAILADPSRVPEGLTLFPETKSLTDPAPNVDPKSIVGKEMASFELGVTATGTVIAVDETPLAAVAESRMRGSVEADHRLVEGSIDYQVGEPTAEGEIVTFPLTVGAAQVRILDAKALLAQVKGKAVPQARAILAPYGDVRLSVWPDWVTAIPTLDARVELVVATATETTPGESPTAGTSAQPAGGTPSQSVSPADSSGEPTASPP